MERMKKSTTSLLVSIILLSVFFVINPVETCKAEVNVLHVGLDYDYENIHSAIEAANESDIIYIHSGTYNENIEIDKSITLIGSSKINTIISGNTNKHVMKIIANFVNISNITIQDTTGSGYDCIMIDKADYCNIQNNIIQNSNDAGISLFDSNKNSINDNTIKNNNEYGVTISYSDNNIILNNEIYYNENGIDIGSYSNNNEVYNNEIIGKPGILLGIGLNIRVNTIGNSIYKNKLNHFNQNARDQGTDNIWYKSTSMEGNYWDDYTGQKSSQGFGTIPYDIPGDANSQDIYPLGYFLNPIIPTAEIVMVSPNPAFEGQTIYFEGFVTDVGSIIDWEWKVNSNVIGHSEDFEYLGLPQGTYTVGFRVKNNEEIWSSWTMYEELLVINSIPIDENQKPTATIQTIFPSPVKYGEKVYFQGYGTDADGDIQSYYWESSIDGHLSIDSSFSKNNLTVGTHNISFKVRDNDYEWSKVDYRNLIIQKNQSISNIPPVAITNGPYEAYVNDSIDFNASNSYDIDGIIVYYLWDFGDGNAIYGKVINHIYTEAGNYNVNLTVTDNTGDTNSNTTIVTITVMSSNDEDNNAIPGFEVNLFLIIISFLIIIIKIKKKKII
jgi:parallel beta-helix repeat protein